MVDHSPNIAWTDLNSLSRGHHAAPMTHIPGPTNHQCIPNYPMDIVCSGIKFAGAGCGCFGHTHTEEQDHYIQLPNHFGTPVSQILC